MAELKKLRQTLDPFQLGKVIDQKLERIYERANRRLSPKATQENQATHCKEEAQHSRRNGCGKAARWKSPKPDFSTDLQIAQKARDSHFPAAATTADLRLHF